MKRRHPMGWKEEGEEMERVWEVNMRKGRNTSSIRNENDLQPRQK